MYTSYPTIYYCTSTSKSEEQLKIRPEHDVAHRKGREQDLQKKETAKQDFAENHKAEIHKNRRNMGRRSMLILQ